MDGETRYEGSQEHKITTRNLMEKMDDVSKIWMEKRIMYGGITLSSVQNPSFGSNLQWVSWNFSWCSKIKHKFYIWEK